MATCFVLFSLLQIFPFCLTGYQSVTCVSELISNSIFASIGAILPVFYLLNPHIVYTVVSLFNG